jgi:class 3 adenylate cyclase
MLSERIQRQLDGLLDEAEAAVRALDWKTARSRAEAALALDPENADARTFLDAAARGGASPPSQPASVSEARSALTLPASFCSERYAVRRFLGEGAKKRVYLAHDTRLDRDVAFALVKTEGLDADSVVRVRREAQAMGRLGDHPHIVTIFDTGDEGGAPFIVSQYRGGGSVEDVLATAEGHRIPPDRAMRIGEQVCQALQHAHSRAIIHRDLKPGNVWLDADGNAALGDFGLAIALDRSRMTMVGMMVGTVAYMAPEQALGRAPDARSDLYALGAMLYEMVSGRPPFLGEDAVAIISQHINTAPVAPSWTEPSVPKPLESLILRLLAKPPDDRPVSAEDVAAELRSILDRTTQESLVEAHGEVMNDLRGVNWGAFVGRQQEMDEMKAILERTLSGEGTLVTLVGEPGIGKTRLAEQFAVYATLRGAQVLVGRCYEGEMTAPYRPFVEALRQYARTRPDEELRAEMGTGSPEVAMLVSEIRPRFPDLEIAPPLDAEAERLRLFESVTQFVRNASAASPIVLLLDDIHWADKPSLLLLQHLTRNLTGARVLVIATYRDIELDRTHPLSEVLGRLRRLPNFQRLLLRGLPEATLEGLLAAADSSEENAPARRVLAAALHKETEGNPFFVREILSYLLEEGKIKREGGRWEFGSLTISELGIPEGVREVIGRRLTRLSDGCNRMLTVASTMTGGFSWEALKAITADVPESLLLELLEEALAAQLVAERKGEVEGTYEFTHALIRQTLYEELSGPRRVLLHRQIGEAIERLYAHNIERHLPELAHHFYQAAPGGDVRKAIDYTTRAGERAVALYAWEEAAGHFERALQAMDLTGPVDDRQRFDLLMRLGAAHGFLGDGASARAVYERATFVAKSAGLVAQQARAAERYAGSLAIFSDPARSVAMLEEALAALPDGDSSERAHVMARLAAVQYFHAPPDRVAEIARRAVGVARRVNDPETLSLVLDSAHFALSGPESVEERIAMVDELLTLASARGDKFAVQDALFLRRTDLAELGDIGGSQRDIEANLAFAKEVRWPLWSASYALAMRPLLEGRFDEGEQLMQRALALGQNLDSQLPVLIFGIQLIGLRYLQGRLAEVEPLVRAQIQQFPNLVTYSCALALVHAEIGEAEEARHEFDKLATREFAVVPRDAQWLVGIYALTEVCDYLADAPRAATLYNLLLPYADRNIVLGQPAICIGSASRPLGMMALIMGRHDDAERHLEDALAFDRRMNARPWVAHDQYHYARLLLARAAPDDRAKALGLLQQALDTAEELGMKKIVERALGLKLEMQGLSSASIYTSIDAVAGAVERERPGISVHPAPDGTVTIMFSDIEDSSVLTERLGDHAWQELLQTHNALIREQLRANDGYEVKTMGDGFMVAFQSAKKGLACAIAIQRAFAEQTEADGEHVRVRIGLHAGEAIKDGDDFYGKNVILASRVAGKAMGGEILVSSLLRQLVESSVGAGIFAQARNVELKGLAGTHTVYGVRWSS